MLARHLPLFSLTKLHSFIPNSFSVSPQQVLCCSFLLTPFPCIIIGPSLGSSSFRAHALLCHGLPMGCRWTSAPAPAALHPCTPPPLSVVLAGPFLTPFTSALAVLQHIALPSHCPRTFWPHLMGPCGLGTGTHTGMHSVEAGGNICSTCLARWYTRNWSISLHLAW